MRPLKNTWNNASKTAASQRLVFDSVLYSRVFCIQQRLVFKSVLYSWHSWNPECLEIYSILYSKASCMCSGYSWNPERLEIESILYSKAFRIWECLSLGAFCIQKHLVCIQDILGIQSVLKMRASCIQERLSIQSVLYSRVLYPKASSIQEQFFYFLFLSGCQQGPYILPGPGFGSWPGSKNASYHCSWHGSNQGMFLTEILSGLRNWKKWPKISAKFTILLRKQTYKVF